VQDAALHLVPLFQFRMGKRDNLFDRTLALAEQKRDNEKLTRSLSIKIESEIAAFVQKDVSHNNPTHYQKRLDN
jgi:hypothetical protein